MYTFRPFNNKMGRTYNVWRVGIRDGVDGQHGTHGTNGLDGTHGLTGAKGDKGDKGDVGPKGDKGDAGTDAKRVSARVQLDGSGNHTWTFPTGSFASGTVPRISAIAEAPSDTVVIHLSGTPTHLACTVRGTRPVGSVLSVLGLSVLGVGGPAAGIWVHLTAEF